LGGMRSKLEAARLATRAGILTFIGPGRTDRVLHRVLEGEALGTWCEPERRISARKRWLALGKRPVQGKIRIDSGAEKALRSGGKSLLPSGVRAVEGEFERGDLVCVVGADASEIAIGLTRYSSIELESIKGRRTGDITPILGDRQSFEVIHRDDMVVTTSSGVENG
jgi:glutamate 5-kinase